MNSFEIVKKTIEFKNPERIALDLPTIGFSDFYSLPLLPIKGWQPLREGEDEWGCIWKKASFDKTMGQVRGHPLKDWSKLEELRIPDIGDYRFDLAKLIIDSGIAKDRFKVGPGFQLFERMHYLRGFGQLLEDLVSGVKECEILADKITEYCLHLVEKCGKTGIEGIMCSDDWGSETKLIINPDLWRKFFKPRYRRMISKAKEYGMKVFLHSCGHISMILDDFIEIGLDVIQMDQQNIMDIEKLAERFGGKLTFYCPIDIQKMAKLRPEKIETEVRKLIKNFSSFGGGFIAKEYPSPKAIGVSKEQNLIMDKAFIEYANFRGLENLTS